MPINGKDTYYEFFGLPNFEEDMDKVKRAYRSMALKWHPDRHKEEDKPRAERMIKQVNEIWQVFSKSKDNYDSYLRNKMATTGQTQKPFGGADSWSTTMGADFTFDWDNLRKAHEEAMRSEVDAMKKEQKIADILRLMRRMKYNQLRQVEDLIHMLGGI